MKPAFGAVLGAVLAVSAVAHAEVQRAEAYQHPETLDLVARVDAAAKLVAEKGEAAFAELRQPGSRWRHGDAYVFVLDPEGKMIVHADPAMEGQNELTLKDINGKPIVQGLIAAASAVPGKTSGWYHYEWPAPGALLPRWKSSYVRLVTAPTGQRFIVGSGMYDDRMERAFVVDLVEQAVQRIEQEGEAAFPLLADPKGPFIAKDAYLFVLDPNAVELVNPGFKNLVGQSMLAWKDARGKLVAREMLRTAQTRGSGWVDYMWPKPGDSAATQKSAYVSRARFGTSWVVVGCGVYLADAPKLATRGKKLTAPELMQLVRDGAVVLEREGVKAFPSFRTRGSRWFRDDTYFFVWRMDGTRIFHAADRSLEGKIGSDVKDVLGRAYGQMFLDAAQSPAGEGWVHYMYPKPGDIFPTWKSVFVKRVALPTGEKVLIGSGIYEMQMDKAFIEDVVNRASALVARQGPDAFAQLRDKTGPYVFMDTYVFVDTPEGIEVVNPAQPSIEGRNVLALKDANGREVARDYIENATKDGRTWVEYTWYRPGENAPATKLSFVRKVQAGSATYLVGSGFYPETAK